MEEQERKRRLSDLSQKEVVTAVLILVVIAALITWGVRAYQKSNARAAAVVMQQWAYACSHHQSARCPMTGLDTVVDGYRIEGRVSGADYFWYDVRAEPTSSWRGSVTLYTDDDLTRDYVTHTILADDGERTYVFE